MRHTDPQSPVNPLPPMVMLLVLIMALVEAAFSLGSRGIIGGAQAVGWRAQAIQDFGFSNRAFAWMLENGIVRPDYAIGLVTYPFVHGSFTHMLFAAVMVLALGKFVGERISQWSVLVLFLLSSALGAVVFGLVMPDGPGLIGAFPGVYGLIGGFTCLLWLQLGQVGAQQWRAFTLIGILLGLQLVFGVLFGGGPMWIAEVAGFVVGFFLTFLLVPGGLRRLREKLRHS